MEPIKQWEESWLEQNTQFDPLDSEYAAAAAAVLDDRLALYCHLAERDPDFGAKMLEWDIFVWQHELWTALEQACSEGILLPNEQIAVRLRGCPPQLSRGLWSFLRLCPVQVKHHLAIRYYLVVRMGRQRRTGNPEWTVGQLETPIATADELMFKWGPRFTRFRYVW